MEWHQSFLFPFDFFFLPKFSKLIWDLGVRSDLKVCVLAGIMEVFFPPRPHGVEDKCIHILQVFISILGDAHDIRMVNASALFKIL